MGVCGEVLEMILRTDATNSANGTHIGVEMILSISKSKFYTRRGHSRN